MDESEFTWEALHEMVEKRMEMDRKAAEELGRDVDELIDGNCSRCGRDYYSDYLEQNLCLLCFKDSSKTYP